MGLCWGGFRRFFELWIGFSSSSYLVLDFSSVSNPPEVDPDALFTILCSYRAFEVEQIFWTVLGPKLGRKPQPKTFQKCFEKQLKMLQF